MFDLRKVNKGQSVILMTVCFFIIGVILSFQPNYQMTQLGSLVSYIIMTVPIFSWYQADAKENSFNRNLLQDAAVFAFFIVGLVIYFVRSRGFFPGFYSFIKLTFIGSLISVIFVFMGLWVSISIQKFF